MDLQALIAIARCINRVAYLRRRKTSSPAFSHIEETQKIVNETLSVLTGTPLLKSGLKLKGVGKGADCCAYAVVLDDGTVMDYVIKVYRDSRMHRYIPKKRDPIAKKYFLFPVWRGKYVVIQPRAVRNAKLNNRAMRAINRDFDYTKSELSDLHHGNVGFFNGQPCLIDWNH